jgi:hypothetical protein
MAYTQAELQNAGYHYTGLYREEMMGVGYLQRQAFELDVRIQDLVAYRLKNGVWALFLKPDYKKGFQSESLM